MSKMWRSVSVWQQENFDQPTFLLVLFLIVLIIVFLVIIVILIVIFVGILSSFVSCGRRRGRPVFFLILVVLIIFINFVRYWS